METHWFSIAKESKFNTQMRVHATPHKVSGSPANGVVMEATQVAEWLLSLEVDRMWLPQRFPTFVTLN
jgi:hypothetical protein